MPFLNRSSFIKESGKYLTLLSILVCAPDAYGQEPTSTPAQSQLTAQQLEHIGERQRLSDPDLVAAMQKLAGWTQFTTYEFYLLNLPIEATHVLTTPYGADGQKWYNISAIKDSGHGFLFSTPGSMRPRGATIFNAPNPSQERFVLVNGFNSDNPLPIGVARGLADSFLAGLIAKLYLHSYSQEFQLQAPLLEQIPFREVPAADRLALRRLQDPRTYGYNPKTKKPISETQFREKLAEAARQINIQPTGMLIGWACATDMIATDGNTEELQQVAWKLIKNRFSGREVAKITAYTLSYLEGWAKGTQNRSAGTQGVPDVATIFKDLAAQSAASQPNERFAALFFRHLLSVYSATLVGDNSALQRDERAATAKLFRDTIEGYYEGTITAADSLFNAAYSLGYNAGYQKGFSDGYTAGFAAGKQSVPAPEHVDASNLINVGIERAKTFLKQTPLGNAVDNVLNVVNKVPGVKEIKDKASNWLSKRIGWKIRL